MKRLPLAALVASALMPALAVAAPALARPDITDQDSALSARPGAEPQFPTDGRPIIATVVAIDEDALRVMLSTPHGSIALSVTQEVVQHLSVGDIVVVQVTGEDDSPSVSPPTEGPAREPASTDRLSI